MPRYIDADAFLKEYGKIYCYDCEKRKGVKNGKRRFLYEIGDVPCRACDVGDMLDAVEDFKAADVVPVKRGKWEYIGGYGYQYRCSECVTCAQFKTLFCPRCGARMDGGNND